MTRFAWQSNAIEGGAKTKGILRILRGHFATLTAREKEVIGFVTAGLLNKQVAGELGVSEVTVKMHRGNIMRKMQAQSLADLVRMADCLGVSCAKPTSP